MTDVETERAGEKPRNSAQTIERILLAAEQEFGTHGLDGAKIEDIARVAGISKQLIYHYFNGKDDLYSEMLSSIACRNYDLLCALDYQALTPEGSLRAFFEKLFDIFQENHFASTLTIDQGLHSGAQVRFSRHVQRAREEFREKLAEPLSKGQEEGVIAASATPESVHFLAVVLVSGCLSLGPMFRRYTGADKPDEDTLALRTEYSDFFMRAIRA
jgi:AcrR family transcriptional regulator